jgi:hypothetical protein
MEELRLAEEQRRLAEADLAAARAALQVSGWG